MGLDIVELMIAVEGSFDIDIPNEDAAHSRRHSYSSTTWLLDCRRQSPPIRTA